MQKEIVIQKILFPEGERFEYHYEIFYKGSFIVKTENGIHHLNKFERYDFATYFNSVSMNKWLSYTDAKSIKLKLRLSGEGVIHITGYSLKPMCSVRREYYVQKFKSENETEIICEYPLGQDEQVAFEIETYGDSILYGGEYVAEYEEKDIRSIELAIATTTCRKEKDITSNVKLLKEDLLEGAENEYGEHIFLHVIDNGNTLTSDDINGNHVYLHPNHNTGGSGGFARGMLESLYQEPTATHVLLMDDDVVVIPESVRRTYVLLKVLRPENYDDYVSGAMLNYDDMYLQREDIGCMNSHGNTWMIKEQKDVRELDNVIYNNREFPRTQYQYQAWWYCCIPTHIIRKTGLPLPLFIRMDDVEYSIRSNAQMLTINGICIWHVGFANKYNAVMDLYQVFRNRMIAAATTGTLNMDQMILKLKREFRRFLLEFNYDSAELLLITLQDYMKGPEFIEKDQGEALMREYSKYNEKLVPLNEIEGIEKMNVQMEEVYLVRPFKGLKKLLYRATYNGHLFISEKRLDQSVSVIGYDWSYQPLKQAMHRQILAVNIIDRTGSLRTIDKKRFNDLQKRFHKTWKEFTRHRKEIEASYAAKRDYLTSEEFWRKYLEI